MDNLDFRLPCPPDLSHRMPLPCWKVSTSVPSMAPHVGDAKEAQTRASFDGAAKCAAVTVPVWPPLALGKGKLDGDGRDGESACDGHGSAWRVRGWHDPKT